MIYKLLETKIERLSFDRADILKKMDVYLLNDRISEEEYNRLVALMDAKEVPASEE